MATGAAKPYLIVLGLLVATSFALAYSVDVNLVDKAGVTVELPAQLGSWKGEVLRFCSNQVCQAQYYSGQLTNSAVCAKCGGGLHGLSKVELDLLPSDTEGIKGRYESSDGRKVMASIVLSGKERASIHRPERCLSGQGSEVARSEVIEVPVEGRAPLKVKILELAHERGASEQSKVVYGTYYAYWFVGNGRETPEHWQRMIWMASDRIFQNRAHRWAYIAIAGVRVEGNKDYQREVRELVSLLYPQIALKN